MKNLTEVSKNLNPRKFCEVFNGKQKFERHITDNDKAIVDLVFNQMTYIFSAWAKTWVDTEVIANTKKEWTKAFFENGINSVEQIKMGLAKARSSGTDFLPSPGKFISWCKPNPEDLGYPSVEKAKRLCIAHRSKERLNVNTGMVTRPLIKKLCGLIDWWLIDAGTNQADYRKGDKHFEKRYLELIGSGYQEPKETLSPRLETEKETKPRMSEQQIIDSRKVGNDAIAKVRRQLKLKGK